MATTSLSANAPHKLKWRDILALIFCLIIFWPCIRPTWLLLTTPSGSRIPKEKPEEELRVYHPYGFSIIAPKNWKARVEVGEEAFRGSTAIRMSPNDPLLPRHTASIQLILFSSQPDDLSRYTPTTFQELPAHKLEGSSPGIGWEMPPSFSFSLYFQRGPDWNRLVYHIPQKLDSLPPEILPYFESFKTHRRELHSMTQE